MILDFDIADASEGAVSVHNAYNNIIVVYRSDIVSSYPAVVRAIPAGIAFFIFIFFMQHTQYTLLFFVQSYNSKKF